MCQSNNDLNYINNFGTAVRYTLLGGLIHEFGHALGGKEDPKVGELGDRLTDYQATNIPFVNDIWSELTLNGMPGLDLMISYLTNVIVANNQDARLGIIAFKDAANGEPSQVIRPFTDRTEFANTITGTLV